MGKVTDEVKAKVVADYHTLKGDQKTRCWKLAEMHGFSSSTITKWVIASPTYTRAIRAFTQVEKTAILNAYANSLLQEESQKIRAIAKEFNRAISSIKKICTPHIQGEQYFDYKQQMF